MHFSKPIALVSVALLALVAAIMAQQMPNEDDALWRYLSVSGGGASRDDDEHWKISRDDDDQHWRIGRDDDQHWRILAARGGLPSRDDDDEHKYDQYTVHTNGFGGPKVIREEADSDEKWRFSWKKFKKALKKIIKENKEHALTGKLPTDAEEDQYCYCITAPCGCTHLNTWFDDDERFATAELIDDDDERYASAEFIDDDEESYDSAKFIDDDDEFRLSPAVLKRLKNIRKRKYNRRLPYVKVGGKKLFDGDRIHARGRYIEKSISDDDQIAPFFEESTEMETPEIMG